MFTPEKFKEKSAHLSNMVGKQYDVTSASGYDDVTLGDKPTATLTDVKKRLEEGSLRVLVMGKFSSGKSTFLNAMMGKMLLPAKPTPTTAVIGEIQYADEAGATLYPKKKTGKKPFNIQIEDLDKYIIIDHETANKGDEPKETPYAKIVIRYPLHICKMGIDFVDSPGLDDPTCHDAITLNYLPTADAIVYCMNSQMAFSARDKAEIEHLRALGYKSIIFVLTYFDLLEMNDLMSGKHDAEDARRHYTSVLAPYTDLGTEGIFFVGSLPALMGKIKKDNSMLESSHLPAMEKKLEQILFNERGRLKLIKALYSVKKVNRETGRFLSDRLEILRQDQSTLAGKLSVAQQNLNKAKEKAGLISGNFAEGANTLVSGINDRARAYFNTEVVPHISEWVNEFKPAENEEISMWHPQKTGKIFSEACLKFFQTKLETSISAWCTEELVPQYIEPKLKELAEQQNTSLSALEDDLKNVRGNLSMSIMTEEPDEISGTNRILSAIAGVLLLNPAAAINGGAMGWEGLLPTLVTTIITNIILYIVAYFTGPIGWVAIILTNIAVFFVGSAIGLGSIEGKAKKKIAETIKQEITKHQDEFVNNITSSIGEIVNKLKEAVDIEINKPVNQYQQLLDEAKKDINAEGKTIEQQISTKSTMLKDNSCIADELEDFGHDININL